MTNEEIIKQYLSLKADCLQNPYFIALLKQVEADIKNSVSESQEKAVEAFYMLKALEALQGALHTCEVTYESIVHEQEALQSPY